MRMSPMSVQEEVGIREEKGRKKKDRTHTY